MIYRYIFPEILQIFHGILNANYKNCYVICQFPGCHNEIKRKHITDHLTRCKFGDRGAPGEVIGVKYWPWFLPGEKEALKLRYGNYGEVMDIFWRQGQNYVECLGCAMDLKDRDKCTCLDPEPIYTDAEWSIWEVQIAAKMQEWLALISSVDAELLAQFKLARRSS